MGYIVFAFAIITLTIMLALSGWRKIPIFPPCVSAMCYVPARVHTTEYTCPKCGMRTIYPSGTEYHITDGARELNTTSLKKLGVSKIEFDRLQFCKSCNPGITNPRLAAIISYEDGRELLRIEEISSCDYRFLYLLFKAINNSDMKSFADRERRSIDDCYARFGELLGIDVKILKNEVEKDQK